MREELIRPEETPAFTDLRDGLAVLLEEVRRQAARSVNALMTATYGEIGRCLVEYEQQGAERAGQGERLLERLSQGLTARFKRGFSVDNLENMRAFYLHYPPDLMRGLSWPSTTPVGKKKQGGEGALSLSVTAVRLPPRKRRAGWSGGAGEKGGESGSP